MSKYTFLVQGREKEPYLVTFTKEGNKLGITCTCKAFQNGSFCKHRVRILEGKIESIVSQNIHEVSLVSELSKDSTLLSLINEVKSIEGKISRLQLKLSQCKYQLSSAMVEGISTKNGPSETFKLISNDIQTMSTNIAPITELENQSNSFIIGKWIAEKIRNLFAA